MLERFKNWRNKKAKKPTQPQLAKKTSTDEPKAEGPRRKGGFFANWKEDKARKRFEYILNRAERGDIVAQYEVGVKYYEGSGVTQSSEKALVWFEKAANRKHLGAAYATAELYKDSGRFADAIEWYGIASKRGHAQARLELSKILFEGEGQGIVKNRKEALKWANKVAGRKWLGLRSAAGPRERAEAQYLIGKIFEAEGDSWQNQTGNKRAMKLNDKRSVKAYEKALAAFRKAAKANNLDAKLALARIYQKDLKTRDVNRSIYWLKEAAKQGRVQANIDVDLSFNVEGQGKMNAAEFAKMCQRAFGGK